MTLRALSLLFPLVCTPAVSFVVLPANLLLCGQQRGEEVAEWGLSKTVGGTLTSRATQRVRVSEDNTPRSPVTLPPSDTVSYLQNPKTGARVWLVGIIHEAAPYVELVKRTIREVKPQVVMLELDAENIFLLPEGEAKQGPNGLWWWEPEQQLQEPRVPGVSTRASRQRRRKNKSRRSSAVDSTAEVDEIWAAGREAQACGARVLLGDRSGKVSKEREAAANRADSEMLRELSKGSGAKRRKLEKAGEGLQVLMALIERRRASGIEMPESRAIVSEHSELHRLLGPRAFDVAITERDEVMAKNLMTLEGRRTTVAVLGSAHLDGMESILSTNGWVKAVSKTRLDIEQLDRP